MAYNAYLALLVYDLVFGLEFGHDLLQAGGQLASIV